MYAVVKTGGKQYRVAKDDKIVIDRVDGEAGDNIVLNQVLMMGDGDKVTLGTPTVAGAAVGATVLRQTRGPKIMVFRRKRRKNFRRVRGHRQDLTLVQITDIAADGKLKPAKPTKKAAAKPEAPKTESKKTEAKTAPAKKAEAPKTEPKKVEAKKAPAKKASAKKPVAKKAAAKKPAAKKAKK